MTAGATAQDTKGATPDLSGVTITVGQQGSDKEFGFLASKLFDSAPYKDQVRDVLEPGQHADGARDEILSTS